MGTPLPDFYKKPDGKLYQSGTEWEYLDAFWAAQQTGRPILIVYRRNLPTLDVDDPQFQEKQAQHQRIQDFFATYSDPQSGASSLGYNPYSEVQEFATKLEGHLRNVIRRVAEIKIKKQVRRLVLRYHRLDPTHDKIKVINALAAIGEPAQEALWEIHTKVLLAARHGSDTDVELLRQLNLIPSDFVVHSFRPPMEEAMSRLWSQLG